jgi:hypothetical protein
MSLPHAAIENLSPEPPTPTVSSVSSSDMTFEDILPMSGMSSAKTSDNDLEEHPTLYIREDMIKIQVRGPAYAMPHDDRGDSRFNAPSLGFHSTF